MIKLFEQYNEYNQIKDWLDDMGISNYTINDDLTVDVNDYVALTDQGLTEIPIQFGKVTGAFYCEHNNLTTLKGCPSYVGMNFNAKNNKLTTLEGCPEYVAADFNCTMNDLTTLKYCPKEIDGHFSYEDNPLPVVVLNFSYRMTLIEHQEEYGIWNSDGSFNEPRWDLFIKDYKSGLLA